MLDMHGSFYGDGYLGAARSPGRVSLGRRKGPPKVPGHPDPISRRAD